jgi:hypothetical protein
LGKVGVFFRQLTQRGTDLRKNDATHTGHRQTKLLLVSELHKVWTRREKWIWLG